MPEPLSILIVSSDTDTANVFKNLSDVEITSASLHHHNWLEAIQEHTPDVLVVELSSKADLTAALARIERVRSEFADLTIIAESSSKAPELIIAAMRAGAQEFLTKPINEHELSQSVERARRRKQQTSGRGKAGRLITVFAKAGGTGVTTLAVNLGVALAQIETNRAALVDLNLQHGDAASLLNLNPRYSIVDACETDDQISSDKLQSCMTPHATGLSLLAEPPHPAASEEVTPHQVQQVLNHLRSMYPYVIVDTPHVFEPRTMAALDMSDAILVTTVATITSIRATKKVLQLFREMGYSNDKIKLVVNRVGRVDRIDSKELEDTLKVPTYWTVPNNYLAAVDAVNTGMPLTAQKRLSNVAKSIIEMAASVDRFSRNGHSK